MGSQRHDYTQPTPDKYGLPGKSYPTNVPTDFCVVVEDIPADSQGYAPLPAYTQNTDTGVTGLAAAVLTSEQPTKGDGTRKSVRRIYETLPGPWLPDVRHDDRLGFVQVRRRAVKTTPASYGTISATGQTVYQSRDGSALVSWEIQERWGNGSGTPDGDGFPNTPFPIRIDDPTKDRERGPIHVTRQVIASTGAEPATLTYNSGTVTEVTYTYVSPGLRDKVTTTFSLPGPLLTSYVLDELTGLTVPQTTQLVYNGSALVTVTDLFTDYSRQAVDSVTSRDVTKIYPAEVTSVTRIDWIPDSKVWPAVWAGIGGTIDDLADLAAFHIDAERPVKFSRRETTTFQTTVPTLAEIMDGVTQIIPQRYTLQTGGIQFASGPVLCDGFSIGGSATYPASTPTASAYLLLRGSTTAFLKEPRRTKLIAHGLFAVTLPEIPYV